MKRKTVTFKERKWFVEKKEIPTELKNLKYSDKIKVFTEPGMVIFYAEKLSEIFKMEKWRTEENIKNEEKRVQKNNLKEVTKRTKHYDSEAQRERLKRLTIELNFRKGLVEKRF